MAVKKAYQDVVAFLEDNSDKKVKTILDEVIEMVSAKGRAGAGARSFIKSDDGTVVAILDYYFKRWMPLVGEQAVDFGSKAGSASGFNTMCKAGVSNWTKQQRQATAAKAQMIDDLESGDLDRESIADCRAEIEEARTQVLDTDLGFDSKDGVEAYLAEQGIALEAA